MHLQAGASWTRTKHNARQCNCCLTACVLLDIPWPRFIASTHLHRLLYVCKFGPSAGAQEDLEQAVAQDLEPGGELLGVHIDRVREELHPRRFVQPHRRSVRRAFIEVPVDPGAVLKGVLVRGVQVGQAAGI